MDVKALIDEANAYADKAIRKSYIKVMASRFRNWITQPVIVYRLHFAVMTALLFAFILYEFIIY